MRVLLVIIHTLACLFLIAAVLLQAGRGGGVGAAFAGASGQIFGGRGANTFLVRLTSIVAGVFFLTSLSLSMVSSRQRSVMQGAPSPTAPAAPAAAEEDGKPQEAAPTSATPEGQAPAATTGDAKPDADARPGPATSTTP